MLRVNKLADYGTVVMVSLARSQANLANAKQLANETHIPLPTVTKILKRLAHRGLVKSKQGIGGGYVLAVEPEKISVIDIIEAMDNKLDLIECSIPGLCSLEQFCSAKGNWQIIARAIRESLQTITLEKLAQPNVNFKIQIDTVTTKPIRLNEVRH